MKKVLFASTALIATAGVASADITLSGGASMGIGYVDGDTSVKHGIDFALTGSGETDGGLSFGGSYALVDGGSFDGDYTVFIASNGLTLTTGNDVSNAADVGGISDVGYDGLEVDDTAEETAAFATHDVNVSYAFGDVTAAMSIASASSDSWALGVNASFDQFSVAVGIDSDDNMALGAGYSAGAVAANVHFETDGTNEAYGVSVSYTTGDVTVTGALADNGSYEAYGVGVSYDLGGATLGGGISQVNSITRADMGISFSF